jgi:hypothetical protein
MPSPITEYLPDPRDEYTGVCAFCGFPLTKYQIAADLSGTCVNYNDHETVPFSFCMCSDCLCRMQEYVNNGPDEAYRRVYVEAVLTKKKIQGCEEYTPTESTEE